MRKKILVFLHRICVCFFFTREKMLQQSYVGDESTVLMSGWLELAGSKERRWVVLKKSKMVIYASNDRLSESDALQVATLASVSNLEFGDGAREREFGFGLPNGATVKWVASSKLERDRWLELLRTWVPMMKLEQTREMLQRKAEGQAAKEFAEIQRQLALQKILNAEHRVVVLSTFRDYAEILKLGLFEVTASVDVIVRERMAAAHHVANTIEPLLDAANSTIAVANDDQVKNDLAHFVKTTVTLTAELLSAAKMAGHSAESESSFSEMAGRIQDTVAQCLQYLNECSMYDDLARDFRHVRDHAHRVMRALHQIDDDGDDGDDDAGDDNKDSRAAVGVDHAASDIVRHAAEFRKTAQCVLDDVVQLTTRQVKRHHVTEVTRFIGVAHDDPVDVPAQRKQITRGRGTRGGRGAVRDRAAPRQLPMPGSQAAAREQRRLRRRTRADTAMQALTVVDALDKIVEQSKMQIRAASKPEKQDEVFNRAMKLVRTGSRMFDQLAAASEGAQRRASDADKDDVSRSIDADLRGRDADRLHRMSTKLFASLDSLLKSAQTDTVLPLSPRRTAASQRRRATTLKQPIDVDSMLFDDVDDCDSTTTINSSSPSSGGGAAHRVKMATRERSPSADTSKSSTAKGTIRDAQVRLKQISRSIHALARKRQRMSTMHQATRVSTMLSPQRGRGGRGGRGVGGAASTAGGARPLPPRVGISIVSNAPPPRRPMRRQAGTAACSTAPAPSPLIGMSAVVSQCVQTLASASCHLMDAAAAASGEVSSRTREDDEYLCSAAQCVVDAVQQLMLALQQQTDANQQEAGLIAAARCLKASVARLVTSSKVKLPANSVTGSKLNQHANKIYNATQRLEQHIRHQFSASQQHIQQQQQLSGTSSSSSASRDVVNAFEGQQRLSNTREQLAAARRQLPSARQGSAPSRPLLLQEFHAQERVAQLELDLHVVSQSAVSTSAVSNAGFRQS
jgi:I/LWEQ domain